MKTRRFSEADGAASSSPLVHRQCERHKDFGTLKSWSTSTFPCSRKIVAADRPPRLPGISDALDFVIAFGGSSTISPYVKGAISLAIEGIGVDKTANIWDTVSRVVGRDVNLLHTNNVLLIYREREGPVLCRLIGLHAPPIRAWGVEFTACGNESCRPSEYDLIVRNNDCGTRVVCSRCNWRSAALKVDDIKGVLHRLNSTVPDVFWHDYPPSPELRDIFVSVTKSKAKFA